MRTSILATFFVIAAITVQAEKTHTPPTEVKQPPCYCLDPEQIAEHDWDTDLFRKTAQVPAIHLEFLYWKALEGGLFYALKMNQPTPGGDIGAIGNYKNTEFGIDPGFRLGVSFFRAPHYWEVFGQYTRMTSRGSDQTYAPGTAGESLEAVWSFPGGVNLSQARSSIHLNYNVVDLYFTRVYQTNPHLRLRMIGGLSGAWINQNMTINYTDTASSTDYVDLQWKYWGCGFRFGIMGDWYWFEDFYMTSRATFGGFIGPYQNSSLEQTSLKLVHNSTYSDTRSAFNMQLLLGPSWQKAYTKTRIELFAGCEYNFWANLQEVYHSIVGPSIAPKETWINTGQLSFLGLSARLTVDY